MTHLDDRSISIFVDAAGPFDRVLVDHARTVLEEALVSLETAMERRPQVRELALELGMHPRRVVRLLDALGMRGRCRERAVPSTPSPSPSKE